ncbi:MAG: hypothetical protein IJX74_00135 [Clostridia bacterium]|nr:hypothetical protein [Clostridia bacterium]
MKKLSLLLLLLLVAVALIACDSSLNSGNETTASTTDSTSETTEVTTETTTESMTEAGSCGGEIIMTDTTEAETAETTEAETTDSAEINVISIAEALELCGDVGNVTTERYYIRGIILSVDNATYGQMTIQDATGTISVYGTYSEDGKITYGEMENKPYKGDEVLLYCILQNYNGTKEVKNARLISFVSNQDKIDDSAYTAMSIADARDADKGAKVKVSGVVAKIAYANGMKPCGVILVDESGSIYVYSADLAQRVSEGNKITVLASKTYWILDKEMEAAQKWGYEGCCQLEDATLLANDNAKNEFSKNSVTDITVKELLELPVDGDNITSSIYKVNALVSKQQNPGFVNYYFYDIDGKTGSYAYTQCNGADFAWLDEFDGKICTVYITPLNAKSTSGSCYYRLSPVAVIDEGYTFDTKNAPDYALTYHAIPQFTVTEFAADPAMELISSVSSELLGFENVTLSYSSNNEAVKIVTEDGKTVLHCNGEGEATVTVTATFNGVTATDTVVIKSTAAKQMDSLTVEEAILASVGETVTVRGIVGTSVINQAGGFYLIGENEVIAVKLNSADDIKTIKIGDEIVITGTRDRYIKSGKTMHGQTCITGATVDANYYGDNGYVADKLAEEITPEAFYDLDENIDLTTKVYRITATASVTTSQYATNVYLTGSDSNKSVSLYSGNKDQYAWMAQFDGKTVTVDIAACNWNSKDFYRGCVLAVYVDGELVALNEYNFG